MFSACRELLPKAEGCIPQMSSKLVFTHQYISFQAHASDALSSPPVNHKDERQIICEKTMNQTNTIKHIVPRSVCGFGWVKATLVYGLKFLLFLACPQVAIMVISSQGDELLLYSTWERRLGLWAWMRYTLLLMAMGCGKIETQNISLYLSNSWGSPSHLPTHLKNEGIYQYIFLIMQMFSNYCTIARLFNFFLSFPPYISSVCQKKSFLREAPQSY